MIAPDVNLGRSDVKHIQWLLCEASENCSENCVTCLYSKQNIEEFSSTLLTGEPTTREIPKTQDKNFYKQIQDVLCNVGGCDSITCRQCVYSTGGLEEFIQIIEGG